MIYPYLEAGSWKSLFLVIPIEIFDKIMKYYVSDESVSKEIHSS